LRSSFGRIHFPGPLLNRLANKRLRSCVTFNFDDPDIRVVIDASIHPAIERGLIRHIGRPPHPFSLKISFRRVELKRLSDPENDQNNSSVRIALAQYGGKAALGLRAAEKSSDPKFAF
jgi:hypothetical protein